MGLLAKSTTKKRVQPAQGPLNEALQEREPWAVDGGIPAGGLIRSVVFGIDLTGARSTSARGYGASFGPSRASQLWVRLKTSRTWSFVLGMEGTQGAVAKDWEVDLAIAPTEVGVATAGYVTRDDALVNGDHHDALRNELLRALGQGRAFDGDRGESDVSSASLAQPLVFTTPPTSETAVGFKLVCSLDEATAWEHLRLLGYRVLPATQGGRRWGLGLPTNDDHDDVALDWTAVGLEGSARIGSQASGERRIAEAGLHAFISRAIFLLGRGGDQVTFEGDPQWKMS
jgi:hypothetical protein